MNNEYLTKKETEQVKYLFTLVKDTIDFFNEVKVEADLSDAELKDFKLKFLRVLANSMKVDDISIIINHYDELIEQNKELQSALISTNKILDGIKNDLEECCEECLCRLNECRISKHPNFQDLQEKINATRIED